MLFSMLALVAAQPAERPVCRSIPVNLTQYKRICASRAEWRAYDRAIAQRKDLPIGGRL